MIAAAALPTIDPQTETRVEFVGGTRDGERRVFERVEPDGGPGKAQVMECLDGTRHEVYVRRATPSRCTVDGTLSWHYDLDRGAVHA